MYNKDLIFKKMKDKVLTNVEIALLFSYLVITKNKRNRFKSREVIELFNINSSDMDYEMKRDFSKEINSYSEGNEENTESIENPKFYKVFKISANKYEYEMTNLGITTLFDVLNEKWGENEIVDINLAIESENIVSTSTVEMSLMEIIDSFGKGIFVIPKYQRGYVWTNSQASSLLESVCKNYPIGSFLNWNVNNINYLIDGQQRTQTLIKIYETPLKFVDTRIFKKYIDYNNEFDIEDTMPKFEKIRNLTIEEIENYTNQEIGDIRKLKDACLSFARKITIDNKQKFPVTIINNATEDNIIEIFELLNTTGTKLTKFEILASKWSKHSIKIKNQTWKNKIKALYNENTINGIETRENVNTPGEIFYVLLQLSLDKKSTILKHLFKNKSAESFELDPSVHYSLLWLFRVWFAYEKKLKVEAKTFTEEFDISLGEYIAEVANNDFSKLVDLKNKIIEVWEEIESKVRILSEIKKSETIFNSISKNLFISLAAQILYQKLCDEKYKVNSNIQYHVISEIVNKNFSSSTNTKVKNDIIKMSYLEPITLDSIKKSIENHNNTQKSSIDYDSGFKSTVKFIIAIAYKFYTMQRPVDFHFDHIFPKEAMKKLNVKDGVNSIGNCGQLEGYLNSRKQDAIIEEELLSDRLVLKADELALQGITIAGYKEVIGEITSESLSSQQKQKIFEDFIEKRYEVIINLFIKQISIDSIETLNTN